ncbi:lipoprotein [Niastella sp. OAS944]|uniref:lipoprotein n=1 Tax=Niastella sp. OAS944 TaxID=2664089 RepID=UPI00347CF3B2
MKRIINIFTAIILLSGCSKDDGPIPERVGIEDVPVITTNLESGATAATITLSNQGAFEGKLKVAMYFADAKAPGKDRCGGAEEWVGQQCKIIQSRCGITAIQFFD